MLFFTARCSDSVSPGAVVLTQAFMHAQHTFYCRGTDLGQCFIFILTWNALPLIWLALEIYPTSQPHIAPELEHPTSENQQDSERCSTGRKTRNWNFRDPMGSYPHLSVQRCLTVHTIPEHTCWPCWPLETISESCCPGGCQQDPEEGGARWRKGIHRTSGPQYRQTKGRSWGVCAVPDTGRGDTLEHSPVTSPLLCLTLSTPWQSGQVLWMKQWLNVTRISQITRENLRDKSWIKKKKVGFDSLKKKIWLLLVDRHCNSHVENSGEP